VPWLCLAAACRWYVVQDRIGWFGALGGRRLAVGDPHGIDNVVLWDHRSTVMRDGPAGPNTFVLCVPKRNLFVLVRFMGELHNNNEKLSIKQYEP
jgi:hypothetical protein